MLRIVAFAVSLTFASIVSAQAPLPDITTPKESIGFNMGDDYCLANNVQLEKYWRTLERESDRMKLEVIVTNPAVDWMESVLCSGAASCKGIQMTVTKDVPRWATNRELLIGELECESPESCRNGMFDLGTGVQFARCSCGRKSGTANTH